MAKSDDNSALGCGVILLLGLVFWVVSSAVRAVSQHTSADDAVAGLWAAVPVGLVVSNLLIQASSRPRRLANEAPASAVSTFSAFFRFVPKKRT